MGKHAPWAKAKLRRPQRCIRTPIGSVLLLQRFFVFSQTLHSIQNILAHQVHCRSLWNSANKLSYIGSVQDVFQITPLMSSLSSAAFNASWSIFGKALVEYLVTCMYSTRLREIHKTAHKHLEHFTHFIFPYWQYKFRVFCLLAILACNRVAKSQAFCNY